MLYCSSAVEDTNWKIQETKYMTIKAMLSGFWFWGDLLVGTGFWLLLVGWNLGEFSSHSWTSGCVFSFVLQTKRPNWVWFHPHQIAWDWWLPGYHYYTTDEKVGHLRLEGTTLLKTYYQPSKILQPEQNKKDWNKKILILVPEALVS